MVLGTKKDASTTTFATPQSFNNRRRMHKESKEASRILCTTSAYQAEESLGFAFPNWPCTATKSSPEYPCGVNQEQDKTESAIPEDEGDEDSIKYL